MVGNVDTKTCKRCGTTKSASLFRPRNLVCKACEATAARGRRQTAAYRERSKTEEFVEKQRARVRRWAAKPESRARKAEYDRAYQLVKRQPSPEKAERERVARHKRWLRDRQDPILVRRQRAHERAANAKRRASPAGRVNNRMAANILQSLRGNKRGRRWEGLVGYTLAELVVHLERQFAPDMGWHNMGLWHIDHILPLSSFVFEAPDDPEFKAAWALTNLRPLWAKENLRKRANRLLLL